jgi:uncharacterized protein (TIGR02118 family)
MLKAMFFVHRRSDLGRDGFRRHFREVHAPLIARLPGLRRYVLDFTVSDPGGPAPFCDGVAELWFDDAEALNEALSSTAGAAVMADQPKFLDAPRSQMIMVEELSPM